MKAISYLILRNIIGILRNMKKKKSQIVLVVVVLLFFILMIFANNDMDNSSQLIPNDYISSVYAGMILIVAALVVKQGITKGSSSYRMADVQFVFTSPISPKLILIYGFLKQIGISLVVVLWFLFQSVNIRNMFGLSMDGFWIFLLITFIVALYMPVCSMLLYSITLRDNRTKKVLSNTFIAIATLLALLIVVLAIYKGDPLWAAKVTIGSEYFDYIPILGWVTALLKATRIGFTIKSLSALILLILGFSFIIWRLLSSEIPFYEEVLKNTDEKERMIIAKKSGTASISLTTKKTRNVKVKYKGSGASTLFYRQILEYKKEGFLFINRFTLVMLFVGIVSGLVIKNIDASIQLALFIAIYLNFLFAFNGKWVAELNNTIIYLLPDSSFKKLWYATAINHIKHLVDGIAFFIPVAIILKYNLLATVAYVFSYVAIGAIYIYADVLSRRIFGKTVIGNILVKILCIMFILTPAIVGLIIVTSVFSDNLMIVYLAPFAVVIYSTIMCFFIMLFSKKIFEDIELIE